MQRSKHNAVEQTRYTVHTLAWVQYQTLLQSNNNRRQTDTGTPQPKSVSVNYRYLPATRPNEELR